MVTVTVLRDGTRQCSALSSLLFVIVMEALSREFRVALPWELLYIDDGLFYLGYSLHPISTRCLRECDSCCLIVLVLTYKSEILTLCCHIFKVKQL